MTRKSLYDLAKTRPSIVFHLMKEAFTDSRKCLPKVRHVNDSYRFSYLSRAPCDLIKFF